EAIPVLDRAIKVPEVSRGADHALAAFSGYMQLGDTHSMLGQLDKSIECYKEGLKIQMEALGDTDPRVAETCRKESKENEEKQIFLCSRVSLKEEKNRKMTEKEG
ncbi:kinesin light chain-related protein 1, partial [Tanacetum coccineum]